MTLNIAEHRRNFSDGATSRLFSPSIWANAPVDQVRAGLTQGQYYELVPRQFGPDFATTEGEGGWLIETTGGVSTTVTDEGGHLNISLAATTNYLTLEGANGVGCIQANSDDSANVRAKCWYEARFSVSSVVDDELNVMAGLFLPTIGTGLFDTDVAVDTDLLGWVIEDNGDQVDGMWSATDGAGTPTAASGTASVVAANTFVNVGFLFDPEADTDKRCQFYFNNVLKGSATGANTNSIHWPDTIAMVPGISVESGSGAAGAMVVKVAFIRCLSLF